MIHYDLDIGAWPGVATSVTKTQNGKGRPGFKSLVLNANPSLVQSHWIKPLKMPLESAMDDIGSVEQRQTS